MDINQPSQAEEMPTPVKAFTKNSRKSWNGFVCLNKERYLLFSTSLIHSFSFYDVLWYTMWLCRWWCFVCTVSLTAFDVFFYRPLAAVFLEVDLPSNRAGNEEFAKRNVQSSMGRSQKLCKSRTFAPHIWDVELSIWEIREFRLQDYTAPPGLKYDWDGLNPHDGVYIEIKA